MRTPNPRVATLFFLFTVLVTGPLYAQQDDPAEPPNAPKDEDVYLAGPTVSLLNPVAGDAVVAGGSVSVAGRVSSDVLAAGGTVNVTADINDDLRAAGFSFALAGKVGDDATIAGGSVSLEPDSAVGGKARIMGGAITVAGNIDGDLMVVGKTIALSGTVGGDVSLDAESITIKPGAVIKGNLTYSAPREATIDDDATIEGDVNWNKSGFAFGAGDGADEDATDSWAADFAGNLLFYLSLAVSAFVLFLIFPRFSLSTAQQVLDAPLEHAALGLAILFTTPFAVLMLLVSVLGMPLALIVLASYGVMLIAGLLIGIIWIGDVISRQFDKTPDASNWARAASIAAGAGFLLIIDWIPLIGGLVYFLVWILGIGALALHLGRSYMKRENAQSPG